MKTTLLLSVLLSTLRACSSFVIPQSGLTLSESYEGGILHYIEPIQASTDSPGYIRIDGNIYISSLSFDTINEIVSIHRENPEISSILQIVSSPNNLDIGYFDGSHHVILLFSLYCYV